MVWYIEKGRKTMEKRKILLEKLEEYIEKYQNQYEVKSVESNKNNSQKRERGKEGIENEMPGQSAKWQEKAAFFTENDAENLESLMQNLGETFQETLFRKIRESGFTETEIYKKANLDRKLFSKIRSNPAYHPGKNIVLALAVALRMNLEETQEFLAKAEYALSPANRSDLIVRYFLEREIYDIDTINYALYLFDEPLLGNCAGKGHFLK